MLLPCQKCKKNWNRSIFGPSRCRNAFKSGQILGVLPLFSTWRPLWTPVRAYEPIYTSRHMKYMSWDMWEHSSVHSGSILGRAEGPTAPKNHDFSEFHQFPQRCDPKGGPFTNNYSHTHEIHVLWHARALISTFWIHFGSFGLTSEGPTGPKNHVFPGFCQFPQRGDPKGGPLTNNYSHTHQIHVLGLVGALISTFWMHFGSFWWSDGSQKITIFPGFVNFLSAATPRVALWPTITHTHTKYMYFDRLEHYPVHFGSILGRSDSLRRARRNSAGNFWNWHSF